MIFIYLTTTPEHEVFVVCTCMRWLIHVTCQLGGSRSTEYMMVRKYSAWGEILCVLGTVLCRYVLFSVAPSSTWQTTQSIDSIVLFYCSFIP